MKSEKCSKTDELRIDNMGFGGLMIMQNPADFCYGVDAVLLADFAANNGKAHRTLEIGTGNGAVSLIFSHKSSCEEIVAVELQKSAADLAKKNFENNGLSSRIKLVNCDILDFSDEREFDTVLINPPYFAGGSAITCERSAKEIARHETSAGLEDFLRIASERLCKGGELFMINRPSRLPDIIDFGRKNHLEAKLLQMVVPAPTKAANLVLVKMVKGGGKELKVLPELAVRDEEGNYSRNLEKIYEKT